MKGIKISFTLENDTHYSVAYKNGRKTFEIQFFDGVLVCSFQYDYDRKPLSMAADAKKGDSVELCVYEPRIEMYINGKLVDEEWPLQNRLFELGDEVFADGVTNVEECFCEEKEMPDVVSTFTGGEGWKPDETVFVGDCMPHVEGGRYHILYLRDRHHHCSKWGLGAHEWEHISTEDFENWQIHPKVLPIEKSAEGSFCTGSWIKEGEKQYIYYTIRLPHGAKRPVKRSISYDGYHYEKDESFELFISDKYKVSVARDPKLIKDKNGLYHMFLTTVLVDENKGCLAHYVSKDLDNWGECETPIYVADDGTHPECPDFIEYGGRSYLIYSLNGKAYYKISDDGMTNWREPKDPSVPCESVPKGAVYNGKIIFAGFKRMGGYAGTLTLKSAVADENGELIFGDDL